MAECPVLGKCPFFNDQMANMPSVTIWLKRKYCTSSDFSSCARYRIREAQGAAKVPPDLFPNEQDRAKEILQKA